MKYNKAMYQNMRERLTIKSHDGLKLDLSYMGEKFTKSWPIDNMYEVCQKHSVQVLDVTGNEMGDIPDAIIKFRGLKHLRTLILKENNIKRIHENFWELRNLKRINLEGNGISEVSDSINRIKDLEVLDLSKNDLKIIPSAISELGKLKMLNLRQNQIKKMIDMSRLNDLEYLDISHNNLRVVILDKLTSLKLLYLGGNQLQELPDIEGKETLFLIDVSNNKIRYITEQYVQSPIIRRLIITGNPLNKASEKEVRASCNYELN